MSVCFENIADEFAKLRDFIVNDVERIVAMPVGGNYAAVAIIACGYEALGELRGEQPHEAFARSLPEPLRSAGRSLYDALRNGIVHGYETKRLKVAGLQIELGVSWRKYKHLSRAGNLVFVNVETMAADLRRAFEEYEESLRADSAARDRFVTRRRKGRGMTVYAEAEVAAWHWLVQSSGELRA